MVEVVIYGCVVSGLDRDFGARILAGQLSLARPGLNRFFRNDLFYFVISLDLLF